MSFEPVVPLSGLAGWTLLKRTEAAQSATFQRRPDIARDEAYFREKIGSVTTAAQLVSDRRLLRVSLEAFGLEGDLRAGAFIRKVLEGGTDSGRALARRLADPAYARFAAAFGFGNASGAKTATPGFADGILRDWKARRFEAAIGTRDNTMRLALNARRELAIIAEGGGTERTKWFKILGSKPLRAVVQGGLGLPPSIATLDIDRQVVELDRRITTVFGTGGVSQLRDSAKVETLIRRYLTLADTPARPGQSAALSLLQSSRLNLRF
ncbi:MAG: hypothetical protein RL216_2578 [Pseudomonadota bacterium]|jgi:hypothetical protein